MEEIYPAKNTAAPGTVESESGFGQTRSFDAMRTATQGQESATGRCLTWGAERPSPPEVE
jgi:hypothetical protein